MLDNCIVFPIENRHVIFLNINVVTIIIIITIVICVVPILVNMTTSFFDEKSGIVPCNTEWGRWWQTVEELHIEVMLPANTKAKDVGVHITNSSVTCRILGKTLFSVSSVSQTGDSFMLLCRCCSSVVFNDILQLSLCDRAICFERYTLTKLCGQ